MAYSEAQVARVRKALAGRPGLAEKEMFGGVSFLLHGNMCAGVHDDDLNVRVQPSETEKLLREPGAKPFTLAAVITLASAALAARVTRGGRVERTVVTPVIAAASTGWQPNAG